MPALLTRMSISTPVASKCSNAAMTASSSATSKGRVSTFAVIRKPLCRFISFCSSRPLSMSLARAAARPRAIASPSPSEDPVTSAVLPLRSNKLGRFMSLSRGGASRRQVDPHGRMIRSLIASAISLLIVTDCSFGGLGDTSKWSMRMPLFFCQAPSVIPKAVEAGGFGRGRNARSGRAR